MQIINQNAKCIMIFKVTNKIKKKKVFCNECHKFIYKIENGEVELRNGLKNTRTNGITQTFTCNCGENHKIIFENLIYRKASHSVVKTDS